MQINGVAMPLEAVLALQQGRKVVAIKALRRHFDLGLCEAKQLADAMEKKARDEAPPERGPLEKAFVALTAAQETDDLDFKNLCLDDAKEQTELAIKEFDKFTKQLAHWREKSGEAD